MTTTKQLSRHFNDVYFGGNWTSVSLKDSLEGITWEQAVAKVQHLNSIAALVYHINYYVTAVTKVLQGGPLDAHDKFSFDLPPVTSSHDWEELLSEFFTAARVLITEIEQVDETKLFDNFADQKYGNYYRNLFGLIEHTHYHLGQIVLIRKMLMNENR